MSTTNNFYLVQNAIKECPQIEDATISTIRFKNHTIDILSAILAIFIVTTIYVNQENRERRTCEASIMKASQEDRDDVCFARCLEKEWFYGDASELREWAERKGNTTAALRYWVFRRENKQVLNQSIDLEGAARRERQEATEKGNPSVQGSIVQICQTLWHIRTFPLEQQLSKSVSNILPYVTERSPNLNPDISKCLSVEEDTFFRNLNSDITAWTND